MLTKTSTNDVPKEPAKRRAWVIFQLRCRHSSFAKIGRQLGISTSAVSAAMSMPSERAERAIAAEIGMPVETLFPERFDAQGNRLPQTRPANRSRARGRRNVQVQGAA
jgi:Ner family transcriptional regulator